MFSKINKFFQNKVFHNVHSLKVLCGSLHFNLGELMVVFTPNPEEIGYYLSDLQKSINETPQAVPWHQKKERFSATLHTLVGVYSPKKFMESINSRYKGKQAVLLINCPRLDLNVEDVAKFYRNLRWLAVKRKCAIVIAVPIYDVRTREILQDLFKNKEHPTDQVLSRDIKTTLAVQESDKALIVYKAPLINASAVWAIKSKGEIIQQKPELHVHQPESFYNAY